MLASEVQALLANGAGQNVALCGESFLISVQRASGAVELFTLDPREADPHKKWLSALDTAGTLAGDLRIAGSGERALVAWTGTAARQSDVWLRTLGADNLFATAQRWNTDEASSAQNSGRIASRGGDRAAIAWLDARSGEMQLMARWIGADGKFLSDEILITPRIRVPGAEALVLTGEPSDPTIAMASDGGFLVAWKQMEKRGYRLLGQTFDAQGKPQSSLLEFDSGEDAAPLFKADIDVAPFGSGYATAFGHKDRGVLVRTLQAGGRDLGAPVLAGEHPLCQSVALAELDGGSLAVAWDITVAGPATRLCEHACSRRSSNQDRRSSNRRCPCSATIGSRRSLRLPAAASRSRSSAASSTAATCSCASSTQRERWPVRWCRSRRA